ncbi:MAG: hypothetical protein NVS4B3_00040 [Gemmatimonadaceae bacterium]
MADASPRLRYMKSKAEMSRQVFFALLGGLSLQLACARRSGDAGGHGSDAELLHTAEHQLTSVLVYDIFSPPQASRVYAYASVAAYEALRNGFPGYGTLAGQLHNLSPVPRPEPGVEYSYPVAAVQAFMTVGQGLVASRPRLDSLHASLDEQMRHRSIPRAVYERSVVYGDQVAQHILAWAATDSFVQSRGHAKFSVTSDPSRWVPTPPAYIDGIEPNWRILRPFVMDSNSQFRPAPPLAFDTSAGSPYMAQVQEVRQTGAGLTEAQRAIAAFWDCNPYVMHVQGHAMFATKKISPGGHWMEIVAIAARKAGANMMQSADAYARTAIALADGFISVWDEKYRSAAVRPETVINRYLDEAWEPLLQTPPFPEYTSGHSVVSNAAAAVLSDEFGSALAFVDDSENEYGLPTRSFSSFQQAADEAAISRLYGGIHYRRAIEQGAIQGRKLGALVVQRIRTHVKDAPAARTIASTGAAITR